MIERRELLFGALTGPLPLLRSQTMRAPEVFEAVWREVLDSFCDARHVLRRDGRLLADLRVGDEVLRVDGVAAQAVRPLTLARLEGSTEIRILIHRGRWHAWRLSALGAA